MAGIKIPVEAAFDKGDADRVVSDFAAQFNKLGAAIASATRQKFNPIDKASLEDMKRLNAGFESLKRVSGDLRKRLKATGQGDKPFFDVDWRQMYPDEHSRGRQMQKAFDYVSGGGRFQAPPAAPAPPPGGRPPSPPGGGGGPPTPPAPPPPPGGGRGPRMPNIVGAGLNAMGPGGQIANAGLSTGMAAGLGAGIGAAVGMAAVKLIGAIANKIGAAQQEFIGYDMLKRQLGDVGVQFEGLKESLREAARGLDMTFEEGQKLGTQFAKLSGMSAEQYKTLAEEVNTAGGFGRSFGMDPAQSTQFFAQMRLFQVTQSQEDSRRLALVIGESLAKSKQFAKADEVLEAIAGFTAQQTRVGMNRANAEGYTSFYTGMIGSRIPGMDPASAAALLGRANSTIASGGGAGEAGQNFLYQALGSRLGLDPIQAAMLREQGLFGTGRGTFGEGSLYDSFAKKNGLSRPEAADSDATNLELIMRQMKEVYRDKPMLMVNAMSNLFGVNNSQAMALSSIEPAQLGGIGKRLKKLGINLNDVDATGISRLSQIEADGSLSDDEKDRQTRAAAKQHQEETEGSRTRATINGVERAVQDMAGKAVPLLNDMRMALMLLAGEKGGGPMAIRERFAKAESDERQARIGQAYEKQRSELNTQLAGVASERDALERNSAADKTMSPEKRQENAARIAELRDKERGIKQKMDEARTTHDVSIKEERRKLLHEIQAINTPAADTSINEGDFNAGGVGGGRGKLNPDLPSTEKLDPTGVESPPAGKVGAGSRSWRNNNPGNIEYGDYAKSQGATTSDGRFAVFPTYEAGRKAQENLLFAGKNYRDLPLSQAAKRWAPPNENKSDAYAGALLSAVGGKDKRMSEYSPEERARIMDAQQQIEGWKPARGAVETATPLPRPADTETARGREDFRRFEIAGTFQLNGPNGLPAAAPVTTIATARGPARPAGT
jgi:hypothetical protein